MEPSWRMNWSRNISVFCFFFFCLSEQEDKNCKQEEEKQFQVLRANSCLRSHPCSLPEGVFFFFLIIIFGEGLYDFVLKF